ncbi:MAG: hypothetical protein ACTS73_09200 [Arsenophonus sp. NEOnobi-MAG3]
MIYHEKSTIQVSVSVKLNITSNSLHELISNNGARKLIPTAGFKMILKPCCDNMLNAWLVDTTSVSCHTVIRNGYYHSRPIQIGIGDVEIKVPKIRDRRGNEICFNTHCYPII